MSRAARTTLAATTTLCAGVVWSVHRFQRAEKELMHAGVVRDEERSRVKRERQLDFEVQKELELELKKGQSVSLVNVSGSGDRDNKTLLE